MHANRFKTDKQLADWLEVSAVSISSYRSGARFMDNEKCVKLALELNIDPMLVIMATDMDKAARHGQKSLWEIFSQRTAATVASALIFGGVTLFLTPDNAQASTAPTTASSHTADSVYIM